MFDQRIATGSEGMGLTTLGIIHTLIGIAALVAGFVLGLQLRRVHKARASG